jgi:hypothetical protein
METESYFMGKRYSDIMKTMWFTFFYGGILPIGYFFSVIGLSIYYWYFSFFIYLRVDKNNVIFRRTIKESISMELSTEMIELLEFILPFCTVFRSFIKYFRLVIIYGECIFLENLH